MIKIQSAKNKARTETNFECQKEGCNNPHSKRGLCSEHYIELKYRYLNVKNIDRVTCRHTHRNKLTKTFEAGVIQMRKRGMTISEIETALNLSNVSVRKAIGRAKNDG